MGKQKTTALPAPSQVLPSDVLVANTTGVRTRRVSVQNLLLQLQSLTEANTGDTSDTLIVSNSVGQASSLTLSQLRQLLDAAQRFLPSVRYCYSVAVNGANFQYTFGMPTVSYGSSSYVQPSIVYPFGFSRWDGVAGGRSWCEYTKFLDPTSNFGLIRAWMSLSGFIGSERWFCGFTSGNQATMQSDTPSTHYAVFRYATGLGDATIKAVSCAGVAGTRTETDLGLLPDGTWRVFEVRILPSPARVEFYIDGALVATHTTNLPASAVSSYFYINVGGAGPKMDWRKAWMLAG